MIRFIYFLKLVSNQIQKNEQPFLTTNMREVNHIIQQEQVQLVMYLVKTTETCLLFRENLSWEKQIKSKEQIQRNV